MHAFRSSSTTLAVLFLGLTAQVAHGAAPAAESGKQIVPYGPIARQRGVALGLFSEDVSFSYEPLLQEVKALGASHVALIVPIYQEHAGSTRLYYHTRFSPTLEAVANATRQARRIGLEVTLFPIVRLARPRTPNEWRGTLAPDNRKAWFANYAERIGELAALATFTGATRLVVGSELSSLDGDLDAWRPVIERVRGLFSGTLLYSANWDNYRKARVLDAVDEVGVTAYFNLRKLDEPVDVKRLTGKWRALRAELEAWAGPRGQPLVFTEVGYRSREGSSAEPWNEAGGGKPAPEEQRDALESWKHAWADAPSLAGYYIWNWYGWGGPETTSYTPRGKPATETVREILNTP